VRWGEAEKKLVLLYLHDGRLAVDRLSSASYLAQLKKEEPLWDRHSNKNFNQNVRRTLLAFDVAAKSQKRNGKEEDVGCDDCLCASNCRCEGACVPE
jgi:hypothetical protein